MHGHEVKTVQDMGWSELSNGELLSRIESHFEMFITVDQNITFQQNLTGLKFGVIVIATKSNRYDDITPLVCDLAASLKNIQPGQIKTVGI